jgi:chemotaxis-related protein WspB
MLVLTFQIGADRLALDIRRVREVVPRIALQQPAGSPPWLAGIFIYRGEIVPVLDLHRLVGAGECPAHLSSRIILVPFPGKNQEQLLGLLAAQVADIREVQLPSQPPSSVTRAGAIDLGPKLIESGTILHLLDLDRLLPDSIQRQLITVPEVPA